ENVEDIRIFGPTNPNLLKNISGADAAEFTVKNNCPFTIWPATLTGSGGPASTTGFELASGASPTVKIQPPWSGRLWARTGCTTGDDGKFTCATADCGSGQVACNNAGGVPPASLVELFLAPNNGQDFYDISLVDGFNLPVVLTPRGGSGGCEATGCPANINGACPAPLQMKNPKGDVIGCKSACVVFNTPQFCCSGEFGTPEKCPPTEYSRAFKTQCPQAYSYAYDDKTSTFTCNGGPNYDVTFCP
ncbi:PREDICTED: thaumatin-like protein 1, partial [Tarenaya hassleriana]|uniref:thaumatin-like protein 1 n=1 Tax=Tarenaya hassleriana TaxID=28532 RepID=UPI00053C0A03